MKKLEFKPGMFNGLAQCYDVNQVAAEFAQAKFDKWYLDNVESAPLVYGKKFKICATTNWCATREDEHHDLQARLIDIQEIKKECKHEPKLLSDGNSYRCKTCGVKLVAHWKEKNDCRD